MARKNPPDADRASAPTPSKPADDASLEPVKRVAGEVLLGVGGKLLTLVAIIFIGAAGVFLTIAWIYGPQVWVHAAQYRKFTGRADASIVESWLALELDLSQIRSPQHWRASAKASPCAVVEYGGDWGAPVRRAFCGPLLGFNESYALANLREIAPQVPFAWARDERGFIVPEIRLDASAQQWLATHPADTFMHDKWPAKTALDWLKVELDTPVDLAIAGWSSPAPVMKVAYDPKQPSDALPAATVDERLAARFNWLAVLVGGVGGLVLWFKGMSILPWLANFTRTGQWVIAALPLFGLPWFADAFPQAVRSFNVGFAEIIGDMFGDLDPLGRMVATEPTAAAHAGSVRLVWRAGDGIYTDTFGRLRYVPPQRPHLSADAALVALVDTVTGQVGAMDEANRIELFTHLVRDKQNDLKGAGVIFMPAAKATLLDPKSSAPLRRAAKQFLTEWFTSPTEAFDKYALGYEERLRLYAQVADVR
jgi:hypothetical protein